MAHPCSSFRIILLCLALSSPSQAQEDDTSYRGAGAPLPARLLYVFDVSNSHPPEALQRAREQAEAELWTLPPDGAEIAVIRFGDWAEVYLSPPAPTHPAGPWMYHLSDEAQDALNWGTYGPSGLDGATHYLPALRKVREIAAEQTTLILWFSDGFAQDFVRALPSLLAADRPWYRWCFFSLASTAGPTPRKGLPLLQRLTSATHGRLFRLDQPIVAGSDGSAEIDPAEALRKARRALSSQWGSRADD
jgi:hypothetical protein